jgi:hypothetical protein
LRKQHFLLSAVLVKMGATISVVRVDENPPQHLRQVWNTVLQ